ncbi:MAG: transposase [Planctomyces sp.]
MLRDLWGRNTAGERLCTSNDWYRRVRHRMPEPRKTVAKSIKKRLRNVVSYYSNTHAGAGSEGMSGLFMSMKCCGGGFTKRESVAAVICVCGV